MSVSRLIAIALGSTLVGFGLSRVRAQSDHLTLPKEFINRAAVAGIYEVKAARIALNKAQNAELKTFAATMIKDHTGASEELKAVAGAFPIPTALDRAHQELIDQLNAATSADFDRLYWEKQTEAHKDAVSLFSRFSTEGSNSAVKGFAAKTLSVLQHHQEMLGRLESTVAR